jgi:hypothetical protein
MAQACEALSSNPRATGKKKETKECIRITIYDFNIHQNLESLAFSAVYL